MNIWSSYPKEDDFLKSHFSFFVFWFPNGYGLNGRYTDFGAIGFGAVTLKIVPGAKIVPAYVIHSNPFQTCLATDDRVEWQGRFFNIRELVHWARQDR